MAARGMHRMQLPASSPQAHRASLDGQQSGAYFDACLPRAGTAHRPGHDCARSTSAPAQTCPLQPSIAQHRPSFVNPATALLDARFLLHQPSVIPHDLTSLAFLRMTCRQARLLLLQADMAR